MLLARFGYQLTAVLFIVANIAFQASLQFYDALLPEVSTEKNRGKIGGIGIGVGYIGSFLAVGLSLSLERADQPEDTKPLLFFLYGASFLLLSLPCIFWVKERGRIARPINLAMVVSSTRETCRTLISGKQYPGLLRFLIGRAFYTDSINTVIQVMTLFTINVAVTSGLAEAEAENRAKIIMLLAIIFAICGGFVWGQVTDFIGPKRTLNIVLRIWMGIFVLAAFVGIVGLPLWTMYVVASLAGFGMGGVWSADRPFMLRLTPSDRVGEFYGLYGMVGRFSAVIGPILWALVTTITYRIIAQEGGSEVEYTRISQGVGVLVLLGLMLIAHFILRKVPEGRPATP